MIESSINLKNYFIQSPYVRKIIKRMGEYYIEIPHDSMQAIGQLWDEGDSIMIKHLCGKLQLERVNNLAGINLMADYCSTGVWCHQTGYMLEYFDVPELDNDDIAEIKRILREYETADVDPSLVNQEIEEIAIKAMYEVGKKIKQKNPELHVFFMNHLFEKPVIDSLLVEDRGRSEITLED